MKEVAAFRVQISAQGRSQFGREMQAAANINGVNDFFSQVQICAPANEIDAGIFTLRVPWWLDKLAEADTIILPGLADHTVQQLLNSPLPLRTKTSIGATATNTY